MVFERAANLFRVGACAVLLLAATAPSLASAQENRVGIVDMATVIEQIPQAAAAKERLQTEFAPRNQQMVESAKKIKAMEDKLNRDSDVMSDVERRKLEKEILNGRRELKRTQDEFNDDLNIRRNEEFAKLQQVVHKVIGELAKESNYDLVLDSGVLYASSRVDLTGAVIERLKKAPETTK